MGVIAQYLVSPAAPSIVGGTGATIKYFSSQPPQSLWNSGVTGVNSPISSAQLGATPSATNASGQLSFESVANRTVGGRFRMYASGVALSVTGTPTIQPKIQINSGTIASPSFADLMAPAASAATTANKPVAWSIAGDLYYEPLAAVLTGFFKFSYAATSGGTPASTNTSEAAVTAVTGLTAGNLYLSQFGFVVGIVFGTSVADNSASLYEFKIIQD